MQVALLIIYECIKLFEKLIALFKIYFSFQNHTLPFGAYMVTNAHNCINQCIIQDHLPHARCMWMHDNLEPYLKDTGAWVLKIMLKSNFILGNK